MAAGGIREKAAFSCVMPWFTTKAEFFPPRSLPSSGDQAHPPDQAMVVN